MDDGKGKRQGKEQEEKKDALTGSGGTNEAEDASRKEAAYPGKAGAAAPDVGSEEVDALRERLEKAEGRAREYLDDLQRLKAEFENYRKRMIREQTSLVETANQELSAGFVSKARTSGLPDHHVFPKRSKERFKELGIDPDKLTIGLDQFVHRKLHSGRGARGGAWNRAWDQFLFKDKKTDQTDAAGGL